MMKTVCFRVDSGAAIGTGHVQRCLTLAEALQKTFCCHAFFICRDHPGHISAFIRERGFEVFMLASHNGMTVTDEPYSAWLGTHWQHDAVETKAVIETQCKKVDWLVVDHYAIDERWENELSNTRHRLLVIDDIANRKHLCDLLLDQNLGRCVADYQHLVNPEAKLLLGTQYALLRNEFAALRQQAKQRREHVIKPQRLLVAMGGTDPDNVTGWVIDALVEAGYTLPTDVVLGGSATHLAAVRKQVAQQPWLTLHVDTPKMAELILHADIAIGAAGTSSWERACLGLPSILITIADNQKVIAENLVAIGAAYALGHSKDLKVKMLHVLLQALLIDRKVYQAMAKTAMTVCDGLSCLRVINGMLDR